MFYGRALAATQFVYISDASLVQYQTAPDGLVYLRNINSFDANALGCCYNYFIDTNTIPGKNIFAMFLSFIPQGRGFWVGLSNGYATGTINYSGNW